MVPGRTGLSGFALCLFYLGQLVVKCSVHLLCQIVVLPRGIVHTCRNDSVRHAHFRWRFSAFGVRPRLLPPCVLVSQRVTEHHSRVHPLVPLRVFRSKAGLNNCNTLTVAERSLPVAVPDILIVDNAASSVLDLSKPANPGCIGFTPRRRATRRCHYVPVVATSRGARRGGARRACAGADGSGLLIPM